MPKHLKPHKLVGKRQKYRRLKKEMSSIVSNTSQTVEVFLQKWHTFRRRYNHQRLRNLQNVNTSPVTGVGSTQYLKAGLKEWAIQNKVPHNTLKELLRFLNVVHDQLPLNSRTLLNTPLKTDYKSIEGGDYYHRGIGYNSMCNTSPYIR